MQGVFAYIGTFGGRKMSGGFSGGYTFGFNGQAKDDEVYGEGNTYAFEYRIHDARLGRFLSVDPLMGSYPWNSTFAFAENKVIQFKELEGLEAIDPKETDKIQQNLKKTSASWIESGSGATIMLAHTKYDHSTKSYLFKENVIEGGAPENQRVVTINTFEDGWGNQSFVKSVVPEIDITVSGFIIPDKKGESLFKRDESGFLLPTENDKLLDKIDFIKQNLLVNEAQSTLAIDVFVEKDMPQKDKLSIEANMTSAIRNSGFRGHFITKFLDKGEGEESITVGVSDKGWSKGTTK